MTIADLRIRPETPDLEQAIEQLADRAFGPGRHAKTSYRLREGTSPIPALCLVACLGGRLVGTIRFSPILVGKARCLLLGPLAVEPELKGRGCGLALMREGLSRAYGKGFSRVILVGDLPYYARAGFSRVPGGRITLPGPVDPARLLWLELRQGAFDGVAGMAAPDAT
ncbi:MAG: GNAT family N-acetyltransferase [Flavobacteriaceae bacterium]